jgi:hypothetical protein
LAHPEPAPVLERIDEEHPLVGGERRAVHPPRRCRAASDAISTNKRASPIRNSTGFSGTMRVSPTLANARGWEVVHEGEYSLEHRVRCLCNAAAEGHPRRRRRW